MPELPELNDLIKNIPLFSTLDEEELNKISSIASLHTYHKGQHIFYQEDELTTVFYIHTGKVKIYKNDYAGKEQIVSILTRNEIFPHVGFYRDGYYPAHAQSMDKSKILKLPKTPFEEVLIQNPALNQKLFKLLGEKIIDLQNRLEEQILNNSYQQVIKLLLRLAKQHGITSPDGSTHLHLELTNQELGMMIGASRETISRMLSKLKRKKLLKEESSHIYHFKKNELIDEILNE